MFILKYNLSLNTSTSKYLQEACSWNNYWSPLPTPNSNFHDDLFELAINFAEIAILNRLTIFFFLIYSFVYWYFRPLWLSLELFISINQTNDCLNRKEEQKSEYCKLSYKCHAWGSNPQQYRLPWTRYSIQDAQVCLI